MCISVEDWKFINSFAPWLSALGTLLAVAVSLYISFSTRKINLKISSGIYTFNENGIDEDYLGIQVTNIGFRTVYLNNFVSIAFRAGGFFNKTNIGIGHKYIDPDKSSNFPCKLGENEVAQVFIKIRNTDGNWLENFKKDHLSCRKISSLRIIVFPNIGKPFKVKPDKSISKILDAI